MKRAYEFGLGGELVDCNFLINQLTSLKWGSNSPLFAVLYIEDDLGEMWLLSMEEYAERSSSINDDEDSEVWCLSKETYVRVKDRTGYSSSQKILTNTESTGFYEELCQQFRKIRLRFHYEEESWDD